MYPSGPLPYYCLFLLSFWCYREVISSGFWYLISNWKIFHCIKQRTSITPSFRGPWQTEVKINKCLCFYFSSPNHFNAWQNIFCLLDKRFLELYCLSEKKTYHRNLILFIYCIDIYTYEDCKKKNHIYIYITIFPHSSLLLSISIRESMLDVAKQN